MYFGLVKVNFLYKKELCAFLVQKSLTYRSIIGYGERLAVYVAVNYF